MASVASSSTHDTTRIDGTRIRAVRPLLTPALLQEWLPAPEAAQDLVETSRAAISRVLHGADDRLVVVVGPCSIHDHNQALEYARRLHAEAAHRGITVESLVAPLLHGGAAPVGNPPSPAP